MTVVRDGIGREGGMVRKRRYGEGRRRGTLGGGLCGRGGSRFG